MPESRPLPQLDRIRRSLERESAPLVEVQSWQGSGIQAIFQSLLTHVPSRYRELSADDDAQAWQEDLRSRRYRKVRWWVAPGRPSAKARQAFLDVRNDGQHMVWTAGGVRRRLPDSVLVWRPHRLLLTKAEILGLGRQPGYRDLTFEEAHRLRSITDGWFEPSRRLLTELGEGTELPASIGGALAVPGVHDFVFEELIRGWGEPQVAAMKVLASLETIPVEVARGELRFHSRRLQQGWNALLEDFLMVDSDGRWRLPRLLAGAAREEIGVQDLTEVGEFASKLLATGVLNSMEDIITMTRLTGESRAPESLIEKAWLDLLADAPIEAVQECLGGLDNGSEFEGPGAATLLRHVLSGLQGASAATEASQALVRLSWHGDDPMLAAVAELCSRLLRFVGEGHRPVSGLDISDREQEWPMPLLGLLRLDELASGTERGSREPERFEEAWICLELAGLNSAHASPTPLQGLGLRTIALLASLRPELRSRIERRVSSGGAQLQERLSQWMYRPGVIPVEFRVHLLGPPSIERLRDGEAAESLEGILHREMLLLARLAMAGPTGATREELRTVVWADRSSEFFERNLHPTVSRLRATLRLDDRRYPDPIATEQGVYRLAPQYAWQVDVQAILEAFQAAEDAQVARQVGRERGWLDEIVALDRGDFMPGFDEPWPSGMRQRMQQRRAQAYMRLADLLQDTGQRERAVDLLRRVLADAPANEVAHRKLMVLYRAAGRRDLVLRQYEILVSALEPLGVTPDEETGLLFRELMR